MVHKADDGGRVDRALQRIEREAGVPGLVDVLTERLAPTDLQSLLLEVYRRLAQRRQPAVVLADYEKIGLFGRRRSLRSRSSNGSERLFRTYQIASSPSHSRRLRRWERVPPLH